MRAEPQQVRDGALLAIPDHNRTHPSAGPNPNRRLTQLLSGSEQPQGIRSRPPGRKPVPARGSIYNFVRNQMIKNGVAAQGRLLTAARKFRGQNKQ